MLLSHVTPAVFRAGDQWFLRESLTTGQAENAFMYGQPGDVPVMGDWNGDGVATVGVFRDGIFFLRNSNSKGPGELAFEYGLAGDVPVVGDWDGDGIDTIGIVRENVWHLRNSNTAGGADWFAIFGLAGDTPVVGDWDGDGVDTPGIMRENVWHLRNSATTGGGDVILLYGLPGDVPVVGDWDGTGADSPGIVRDGVWHLRNSLNSGPADQAIVFGSPGDVPLVWGDGDALSNAVVAELVDPMPGEHAIGDPGHVSVRFTSPAGVDAASIDPADVVLVGTGKEPYLVDQISPGVWRFHYHEGARLGPGPVTVRVPAGAVLSGDGHGNQITDLQFTIDPPAAELEVVAGGLNFTGGMDFLPDGRMLFTEKRTGRIRIIENGQVAATPYVDLDVNSFSERGLIGIAVDPEFDTNGFVYATYAHSTTGGDDNGNDLSTISGQRVSRFETTVDGSGDTIGTNETVLSTFPVASAGNHDLGHLHFGPDGMLYVTMGELGLANESQSLASPMGKILRIRSDGTIPPDNPFYDDGDVAQGNDDRVWAYGLRNSFGFHFARGLLVATENGPSDNDEINTIVPGGNYGWPLHRGSGGGSQGFIDPFWQSGHVTAAPVGLTLWRGEWYVGFFVDRSVRKFQIDAGGRTLIDGSDEVEGLELVAETGGSLPIDVAAGPDGRLYVLTHNAMYAIDAPPGDTAVPTASLEQPAPGTIISVDPGFIDIRWTDTGGSGLHSASIDVSDVLITGVTVDSVTDLGSGLYRYRYDVDGDQLPLGRITVGVHAGAVADNAGNTNLQTVRSFTVEA